MTIYKQYTGIPSFPMPDNAVKVFHQVLHYASGTQTVDFYSDDPDSKEDILVVKEAKAQEKGINSRDIPIWM